MKFLRHLGQRTVTPLVTQAGFGMWLCWRTLSLLPHLPRRMRATLDQMHLAGVRSLHVVLFVSFFVGMIVSLQIGLELARFGQQESIGILVAITMTREMGPFITSIILAASVASALAAELGTMKVQEELTALEVMSVNPISYLVLPRVVSLTLVAPILTLLADAVGILGGGVIATAQLHLDMGAYWINVRESLRPMWSSFPLPRDLYSGLIKSTIFGFSIAIVGCSSGLQTTTGALGVGRSTRAAVRDSIILIIVLNFFLSRFLLE